MRVLITDGQGPAAVSAVRSLGRLGIEAEVGASRGSIPLAAFSRYCVGRVPLPDPGIEPDRYAEVLLGQARRPEIDAILPLSDQTFAACADVRPAIERHAAYCAAAPQAIEAAADKWAILEHGRQCGLAAPAAGLVESESDWLDARREVGLPSVHRARRSILRDGSRLAKPAAGVFFDAGAADRDARARLERGEPFVVSRFTRGTGRGVYLFLVAGEALLRFGHVRVRETNPCGSPACAARAEPPDDEQVERCRRLLDALGLEGAAMIEFRRDAEDGTDRLVEINPRLWGSIPLAIGAGLDFAAAQVLFFSRGQVPSMPERPRPVTGYRYLTAELSHLLHAWKGPPPAWKGPFPSFAEARDGILRSFREGYGYYHQSWDDPVPGLVEPIAYAIGRLRRNRT